jgi:peptidyl-prolyl cis-trans isomerase D
MLQLFHKYHHYLVWFVIFSAVLLAFSGFGVDLLTPDRTVYAVKVDKYKVPADRLYREVRQLETRYSQLFGANSDLLLKQFGIDLVDQAIDQTISREVIYRYGQMLGLGISDSALEKELLQNGMSEDALSNQRLLTQLAMTREEFEDQLKRQYVAGKAVEVLTDFARSSDSETVGFYLNKNRGYKVNYIELSSKLVTDPKAPFAKELLPPTSQEIEERYVRDRDNLQSLPSISFNAISITPDSVLDKIEVEQSEIEFEYTENSQRYVNPLSAKLSHIQINYPGDSSDPVKLAATKEKAERLLERAKAGEAFEKLVMEGSDDLTTKATAGDLGWISPGVKSAEFDQGVFTNEQKEGILDLISASYGFHIVKLEDIRPQSQKSFESVKEEIREHLKKENAPSYAEARAEELYDKWTKAKSSLNDLAMQNSLKLISSKGLINVEQELSELPGLVSLLQDYPEDEKRLKVELGGVPLLVEVVERKPADTLPLEAVKEKLITALNNEAIFKLLNVKAEEILVKRRSTKSLEEAIKPLKLEIIKNKEELSREKAAQEGVLANAEVSEFIFSHRLPHQKGLKKFTLAEDPLGLLLLEVVDVIEAKPIATSSADFSRYKKESTTQNAKFLIESLIGTQKAKSEIEINQAVLSGAK